MKRDSRWNLVTQVRQPEGIGINSLQDWALNSTFPPVELETQVTFLRPVTSSCCPLLGLASTCSCTSTSLVPEVASKAGGLIAATLAGLQEEGERLTTSFSCSRAPSQPDALAQQFSSKVEKEATNSGLQLDTTASLLSFPVTMEVTSKSQKRSVRVGTWSAENGFSRDVAFNSTPVKRFFRVGTVARTPWTMSSDDGALSGYCIDMLSEMADEARMDFEYEVQLFDDFGHKLENGSWTGVVGALISGDVDMVVAAMTMTSEREEVIDFVAPYFDQSGISIIIRKPVREQSLFKFMQVWWHIRSTGKQPSLGVEA